MLVTTREIKSVMSPDGPERSIQSEIVTACRVLEAAGQADMVWGHVSIRDPDGRGVWLKGSNLGFDEVTESDVILIDWDGEVLEGTAGRHIEYPIHTEIMARRADVNAVVHTHPLYSIAFAATGWPLKALSHEGSHFVPPDISRFTKTGDLILDRRARPRPRGHARRPPRGPDAAPRDHDRRP